ncbi:hypothetical protein ES332_A01G188600v1 [Gossypium tomentosum]|uniref:Uncharacterized protein n=1 Tax=Gossypium tomentosum TaxID=34277 RepID=A0A5D2RS99_GOSTO|nr:hypothetical protein ES332_A01G188600v1 [Gossypium tomentosum]
MSADKRCCPARNKPILKAIQQNPEQQPQRRQPVEKTRIKINIDLMIDRRLPKHRLHSQNQTPIRQKKV